MGLGELSGAEQLLLFVLQIISLAEIVCDMPGDEEKTLHRAKFCTSEISV